MQEKWSATQYAHNAGLERGKELGRNEAYRRAAALTRAFVDSADDSQVKTTVKLILGDVAAAIEAEITE